MAFWDSVMMPQTVTVTGLLNFINDGTQTHTVILGTATSTDPNFDGLDPADLMVTNLKVPNIAPVSTAPAAQNTNEDTPLVFSSENSNVISVSDTDGGSNPEKA